MMVADPTATVLLVWTASARHRLIEAARDVENRTQVGDQLEAVEALYSGFVIVSAVTSMLIRAGRGHRDVLAAMNTLAIYAAGTVRASDPRIAPFAHSKVLTGWDRVVRDPAEDVSESERLDIALLGVPIADLANAIAELADAIGHAPDTPQALSMVTRDTAVPAARALARDTAALGSPASTPWSPHPGRYDPRDLDTVEGFGETAAAAAWWAHKLTESANKVRRIDQVPDEVLARFRHELRTELLARIHTPDYAHFSWSDGPITSDFDGRCVISLDYDVERDPVLHRATILAGVPPRRWDRVGPHIIMRVLPGKLTVGAGDGQWQTIPVDTTPREPLLRPAADDS